MKIWILAILIFKVIIILFFYYLFSVKSEPPIEEIDTARKSLQNAENNKSNRYSSKYFLLSRMYYDSAMVEWKTQNERLFFLRNYNQAKLYALKSAELSTVAADQSEIASRDLDSELRERIHLMDSLITIYQKFYGELPSSHKEVSSWTKGLLMLKEVENDISNQNLHSATKKMDATEAMLQKVFFDRHEKMLSYFNQYEEWNRWVTKSIKRSKTRKNTILIVDKIAHTAYLYRSGKLVKSYDVELGMNWIGDKAHEGDKATPEGIYKVTDKKEGKDTKYHKALLINYPNEDDLSRFQKNKKEGNVHSNARIGGLIEVHGHGGKGVDWTDGCIALENNEMDEVYKRCAVGSEIVIVGSLVPLNELIRGRE